MHSFETNFQLYIDLESWQMQRIKKGSNNVLSLHPIYIILYIIYSIKLPEEQRYGPFGFAMKLHRPQREPDSPSAAGPWLSAERTRASVKHASHIHCQELVIDLFHYFLLPARFKGPLNAQASLAPNRRARIFYPSIRKGIQA